MAKIKILLTGAGGFLGTKIRTLLNPKGFYHNKEPKLDITDRRQVFCILENFRPDLVINTAAMSNVDRCEDEKELAYKINVGGVDNLVDACNRFGCRLMHVSTDFVFDGRKGMYSEEDEPAPLNYYSITKLDAEKLIMEKMKNFVIARVAILYGYNGDGTERSFVKWMYDSLKEKKPIEITEQVGTPTLIDDAALAFDKLKKEKGIFHVCGPEKLSRYEMALILADEFNFDKKLISRTTSKALGLKAKRPHDTSLSTDKVINMGIKMKGFRKGIKLMHEQMEGDK